MSEETVPGELRLHLAFVEQMRVCLHEAPDDDHYQHLGPDALIGLAERLGLRNLATVLRNMVEVATR